jgi:hypothetical protein
MACFYVSFLIGILTVDFEGTLCDLETIFNLLGWGTVHIHICGQWARKAQLFIHPNRKFCVVILLPSVDKSCRRFHYSAGLLFFLPQNLTNVILMLVFLRFIKQGWMFTNMAGIANVCVNDAHLFRILEEFHCYLLSLRFWLSWQHTGKFNWNFTQCTQMKLAQ